MKNLSMMLVLLALGLLAGCGGSADPGPNTNGDTGPVAKGKIIQPPPKVEPKPLDWPEKLELANSLISSGKLEDGKKLLAELKQARDDEKLSEEQATQLTSLESLFAKQSAILADKERESLLSQAVEEIKNGDLAAASRALDGVLTANPTREQRERAGKLRTKIEATRKTRRELQSQLRLLATDSRSNVRAARSRLLEDAEVALPLLLDALKSDNPVLVSNALEVLGYFQEPKRTLPALIGVIASPKHEKSWPAAIREIGKLNYPGAGVPLLKLALETKEPRQRIAVLEALAVAHDPPSETLVQLLPLVQGDGPTLPTALRAAFRAAAAHRQNDLAARRGLAEVSPEQEQLLAKLPQRLKAIVAADTTDGKLGETATAAMSLGIATGFLEAQPIQGIKVTRPGQKEAQAVVDGQWNSTDAAHMWLHPLSGRPLIVFDLGQVRTVTGIRIWNYNVPGQTDRGWKEVDIFVSPDRALLSRLARGQIPPGSGQPKAGDYSITLPVNFVRGQYVKLEPHSVWNKNHGYGGLTEVEILGF